MYDCITEVRFVKTSAILTYTEDPALQISSLVFKLIRLEPNIFNIFVYVWVNKVWVLFDFVEFPFL